MQGLVQATVRQSMPNPSVCPYVDETTLLRLIGTTAESFTKQGSRLPSVFYRLEGEMRGPSLVFNAHKG